MEIGRPGRNWLKGFKAILLGFNGVLGELNLIRKRLGRRGLRKAPRKGG